EDQFDELGDEPVEGNAAAGTRPDDATLEANGETATDDPDLIGGDAAVGGEADVDLEVAAETRVFDIGGTNFAFDVEEMRVNQGDTVTVNFTSVEGFHDWVVDEFGAATEQVRAGDGVTSVTFVADQAGTFEYYCSVGSHRAAGMVGSLIVE
ncbi:cupredoxin domain-containing protein, partial [Candidatus Pacebacteria bacterium]|nr:cupredoxin domain-containing protein [Candidatus Paceibacterota bacterium]